MKNRFEKKSTLLLCFLGLLLVMALTELIGRFTNLGTGIGQYRMEPYLMTGDTNLPRDYGYVERSGVYIYENREKVESVANRGTFLFHDRASFADDFRSRGRPLRIFVLGGSVVYGTGASSNETRWYVVLEKMLSVALHAPVRLIPTAINSSVSTQERIALDLMVLPRRPDAVLILDGWSDAAAAMTGTRPGDPYNMGVLYEQDYSPFFGIKRFFGNHSEVYRFIANRSFQYPVEMIRRKTLDDPVLRARYAESVASVYLDNISAMLTRCRDAHLACAAFLQPGQAITRHSLDPSFPLNTTDKLTVLAYESIRRKLGSLKYGSFHDLSHAFDSIDKLTYYIDLVHFNDQGQAELAHAMFPIVLKMLRPKSTRQ